MDGVSTKTLVAFSLLDGLYWAFYACFAGFIATYLLACGMTNSFLSMMIAAFMVAAFLGAFFWGGQCDKHHTNRKVFLPEFLAAVSIAIVIFFVANINLWVAACLYPVFGFLAAPLGSNLDAWMLKSFHRDAATYGKARAVGSMGYAVAALVIGLLINQMGYIVMPIGIVCCAVFVLLLAFILKEPVYGKEVEHIEKISASGLLKIKPYMYMIVILFCSGLALAPINNLKIVILQSVGGDVGILGIDSFIGVAVQAVFIFVSGKLKKIPPYVRMTSMVVCILLDMVLIVTAQNSWMVILGSVMANASYGIMLPTVREITEKNVHGALKNTAHSMADAMFGSFAGIIALMYSGFVMDSFGARFVAVIGLVILVIPFIMTLISMIKERKNIKEA